MVLLLVVWLALLPAAAGLASRPVIAASRAGRITATASDPAPGSGSGRRKQKATIAVIGRPNVGKSTIANRMTSKFDSGSIVFDVPGVTRDRTYGEGFWGPHEFTVVDTGGMVFDDKEDEVFLPQIRQQALVALAESSSVLLVVDGKAGCTVLDEQIAAFLRKQNVPTTLAVNKCESPVEGEAQAAEFWSLGLGTPWAVSGLHGTGMGEVMDELVSAFPPPAADGAADDEAAEGDELRVAILGRPNVGKSSLLNRLTSTDRAIVSEVAGTTRDAIDQSIVNHGVRYTFVDTAGVRRQQRVHKGVEEQMVRRSLRAARRADICLLVVDATEGVSEQARRDHRFSHSASARLIYDLGEVGFMRAGPSPSAALIFGQENRLARHIADSGRACVVLVNKWDLVPDKDDRL